MEIVDWVKTLGLVIFEHRDTEIEISIVDIENIRSQLLADKCAVDQLQKALKKEKEITEELRSKLLSVEMARVVQRDKGNVRSYIRNSPQ